MKNIRRNLTIICLINVFAQVLSANSIDDRLFAEIVYTSLEDRNRVNGGHIDPALNGRYLTIDQVGRIAFERILKYAESVGIDQRDITKAIFEGRFCPHFEDLRLLHEGMGVPVGIESPTPAQVVEHKIMQWNRLFGDINRMGEVKTFVNGSEKTINKRDLGIRLLLKFTNTHDFKREFGIDWDGDLTYAEAIRRIRSQHRQGNASEFINNLEEKLNGTPSRGVTGLTDRQCAYSYFRLTAWKADTGTNFRNDYEDLRVKFLISRIPE
jgi:hypothetical protein